MDQSITRATPAYWRARGARAFDEGAGINDHDLSPGVSAIRDWQAGYRQRKAEQARAGLSKAQPQLAEVSPP